MGFKFITETGFLLSDSNLFTINILKFYTNDKTIFYNIKSVQLLLRIVDYLFEKVEKSKKERVTGEKNIEILPYNYKWILQFIQNSG